MISRTVQFKPITAQRNSKKQKQISNFYLKKYKYRTDKLILDSLVVQENSLQDRLKRRGKKTMIHSSTSGLLEAPNKDL